MASDLDSGVWGAEDNVHDMERVASVLGGAYLAWKGIGRDSMMGVALMAVGAALLSRGLTGTCHFYRAMGLSTAAPEPYVEPMAERAHRERTGAEDLRAGDLAQDRVDESSEESFPASDSPSWTPTSSTEPDRL